MIHREVVAEVARRLPYRTQRDVAEMVEVLTEVWLKELVAGRSIIRAIAYQTFTDIQP
jgi:hypothetical protein